MNTRQIKFVNSRGKTEQQDGCKCLCKVPEIRRSMSASRLVDYDECRRSLKRYKISLISAFKIGVMYI